MGHNFYEILYCVRWLVGWTSLYTFKKDPDMRSKYAAKSIKLILFQKCGGAKRANSIGDEALWNNFFLSDPILKAAIIHRRIDSLEYLFYKSCEYYLTYKDSIFIPTRELDQLNT